MVNCLIEKHIQILIFRFLPHSIGMQMNLLCTELNNFYVLALEYFSLSYHFPLKTLGSQSGAVAHAYNYRDLRG